MNLQQIELTEEEIRATDPANIEILAISEKALNDKKGPRVGDYLKMPHGEYTRFTESYSGGLQTGGHEMSRFYLAQSGFVSYSGSLDSGVKVADIRLTDEVKTGLIWFFSGNNSRGRGAVEFQINFRVYELIEGADTRGLPQIVAYQRKCRADKAEKVMRESFNNKMEELPLPVVFISTELISEAEILPLTDELGLYLDSYWWAYSFQPYKQTDIDTVCERLGMTGTYNRYGNFPNTLTLKRA